VSELDKYTENIAKRSLAYRGQSVGGNLTGGGSQTGNSNTTGGGQQVISTSSNIDGVSEITNAKSVNNIPNNPEAFISSNKSVVSIGLPTGRQKALLGNAGQTNEASSSFGGFDITR